MSANNEYEDVEDEDMDMDMDMEESGPLFWRMKLEPNQAQSISEPAVEGYIVHITNACFGAQVKNGSRTVVMNSIQGDEDDDVEEVPICVLRAGNHENHSLDLLFNEAATLSLKGSKISPVYLTGYIQPPVESAGLDPDLEDFHNEELMAALKGRNAAGLNEDEDEDDDVVQEEEETVLPPPQKKQKTSTGSKATKQKNSNKITEKRKTPQTKPKPSQSKPKAQIKSNKVDDEDKKEDKKEEDKTITTKKNKKKKKGMQNMKGGIKYRDMKVGDGDLIKHGQAVRVFYVGQTEKGEVFDKSIAGNGFEFNYGKGDVIKGWDMGLKGMRVGGKRKLVIPSKLGYGQEGSPPKIPPNAQLTFTVEVRSAN